MIADCVLRVVRIVQTLRDVIVPTGYVLKTNTGMSTLTSIIRNQKALTTQDLNPTGLGAIPTIGKSVFIVMNLSTIQAGTPILMMPTIPVQCADITKMQIL